MDDLIAKVLAGEAGREEIDRLEGWLNESGEHRDYFDGTKKMFSQIEHFRSEHKVDTVKAWEKLQARMNAEEHKNGTARVIPISRSRTGLRIAASLMLIAVLALLANYIFNNQAPVPVVLVSQQQVKEEKLPDGSKVTLNRNSEIAYVVNDKNVREVKLKGEAYFEVAHNEELPFEISINDVIIQDIGTAFNVKALPESNTIEVLVESGEVHFFTATNKGLNLVKGEKALYDKTTRQFTRLTPDPVENTMSYKSRVFQFKGAALREVIRQVNEVYGTNIELASEQLGNCRLSVMFNNEEFEALIDLIADTLDLEVERSANKIVLKGQPCAE